MNEKWFTRKAGIITGFSKNGISEINQNNIDTIEFPETIGGTPITGIKEGMIKEFLPLMPVVNKLIYHENHTSINVKYYKFYEKEINETLFETPSSIKEITFYTNLDLNFRKLDKKISASIEKFNICGHRKYTSIDGVIFDSDKRKIIFCPRGRKDKYILPEGTISIGEMAFRGTGLKEIGFPSTLKVIESGAFEKCNLETISIPDHVEEIEACTFEEANCKHIRLPNGLTQINNYMFQRSTIESIEIPCSVKIIGDSAFEGCRNLRKVILHEGLEEIGRSAFSNCGVERIIFPASIKTIRKEAFNNCKATFEFKTEEVKIGVGAFYNCPDNPDYPQKIQGKMLRFGYVYPTPIFKHKEDPSDEEREAVIKELLHFEPDLERSVESLYYDELTERLTDCKNIQNARECIQVGDFTNPVFIPAFIAAIHFDDFDTFCEIAKEEVVTQLPAAEKHKLYIACQKDEDKYFKTLLNNGLLCDGLERELEDALNSIDVKKSKILLERGADPNVRSYYAAWELPVVHNFLFNYREPSFEKEQICNFLINSKANLVYGWTNKIGYSFPSVIFTYTTLETQKKYADELNKRGLINHRFNQNVTPLAIASALHGAESEIVRYMISHGAKIEINSKE